MSMPRTSTKVQIIYLNFFDISQDNGKSINEREFVSELIKNENVNSIYVGPKTERELPINSSRVIIGRTLTRNVFSQVKYQIWLFIALLKRFREMRGKIIICVRPNYMTIVPLFFKWIFGVPYVVKYAGLPIPLIKGLVNVPFGIKWIGIAVHIINVKSASRLWCVTEDIGRYWTDNFKVDPSKIIVLPNGVNTNLFTPYTKGELPKVLEEKIPTADYYAGYAGDLRASGVEYMIYAGRQLINKGYNIIFLIAGTGIDLTKLNEMVKNYNLSDRFIFLNWINYEQLPALYNICDILMAVYPKSYIAQWGSSSQKIYQYLACGKPVIAVRAKDHAFIEENNLGYLVDVEDIDDLSETMAFVLNMQDNAAVKRYEFIKDAYSYEKIVSLFTYYINSTVK